MLVCADALRSRRAVDEYAQRGVGLDVVATAEKLKLGRAKALVIDIGRNPVDGIALARKIDESDAHADRGQRRVRNMEVVLQDEHGAEHERERDDDSVLIVLEPHGAENVERVDVLMQRPGFCDAKACRFQTEEFRIVGVDAGGGHDQRAARPVVERQRGTELDQPVDLRAARPRRRQVGLRARPR